MLLIDAHLDLAYNAINLGRDLTMTVAQERTNLREHSSLWREEAGLITTTLPEIASQTPCLVCGTIFILPSNAKTTLDGVSYNSPREAHEQAWQQFAWYEAQEQAGLIRIVKNKQDLAAVCADDSSTAGLLVLMEGADGIRKPAELERWYNAGLRWLGLSWQQTRYAGGTGAPGGLTLDGIALLHFMEQLGVALDVSHLAEESFWEALDLFHGHVAASHANCRALLGTDHADRYLSDAMIDAVIARGGVIGLALFNKMLVPTWDGHKASVTFDHVMRHIDYVCNRAGDTLHVAIGSDFDGGFGREHVPAEIDTWRDIHKLADALAAHGWQDSDIANVLGVNWQRWFEQILPEA